MNPIDVILHLDKYLEWIINMFGVGVYLILFLIIFCETGLVFTPFLPGDSLLFVAGAFAAKGWMNIFILFVILAAAAIIGDTVNYWIGSFFGEKILSKSRFVRPEHIQRTKEFYKKHGGKTIILARFMPIIRTFAPFVAGIGKMNYVKFLSYNVIGGILWVSVFLAAGFFFGGIGIIKENLTLITLAIIVISLIPAFMEFIKALKKK